MTYSRNNTRQRRGRPPSEQSVRDRDCTIELVKRTGRAQLLFTVADVRRTMNSTPRLQLRKPEYLSHHVSALEGDLILRAGQGDLVEDESSRYKQAKRFLLRERWAEFEAGERVFDDSERVLAALHIALILSEGEAVSTRAVTAVIRSVPELVPEEGSPTGTYLQSLEGRIPPRAQLISSERGRLWTPLGDPPAHPAFDQWVKDAKGTVAFQDGPLSIGISSLSHVVRQLVLLTVKSYQATWGGGGRPVTANEIMREASASTEGKRLLDVLYRRSQSLGAVLGDTCRTRIDGSPRKNALVQKVPNRWGNTTYYDVPGHGDPKLRALYVEYQGLLAHSHQNELLRHIKEAKEAKRLMGSEELARRAIGGARVLHVRKRWRSLEAGVEALLAREAELPTRPTKALWDRIRGLRDMRRKVPELDAPADDSFTAPITAIGLEPDSVLDASRPLLVAEELAEWIPESLLGGATPAEYLGRRKELRRFSNPAFVGPKGRSPRERFSKAVDRVDALVYLSGKMISQGTALATAAANLLGPDLRSPALLERLYQTGDPRDQQVALVALALLGADKQVRSHAYALLEDQAVPLGLAEAAVWSLRITRQLHIDDLPEWLHSTDRNDIIALFRSAIRNARSGRWLMRA